MAKKKPDDEPKREHVGGYPTMMYKAGEQERIAHSESEAQALEADGWSHDPHEGFVAHSKETA